MTVVQFRFVLTAGHEHEVPIIIQRLQQKTAETHEAHSITIGLAPNDFEYEVRFRESAVNDNDPPQLRDIHSETFYPCYYVEFYYFGVFIDVQVCDLPPIQRQQVPSDAHITRYIQPLVETLVKVIYDEHGESKDHIQIGFGSPNFDIPNYIRQTYQDLRKSPLNKETLQFIIRNECPCTSQIEFGLARFAGEEMVDVLNSGDDGVVGGPLSLGFMDNWADENIRYPIMDQGLNLKNCSRLDSLTFGRFDDRMIPVLQALQGHAELKCLAMHSVNVSDGQSDAFWKAVLGIDLDTLKIESESFCSFDLSIQYDGGVFGDRLQQGFWNMLAQHPTIEKVVIGSSPWLIPLELVENALRTNKRIVSIDHALDEEPRDSDVLGDRWNQNIAPYLRVRRSIKALLAMDDAQAQACQWWDLVISERNSLTAVYLLFRDTFQAASASWRSKMMERVRECLVAKRWAQQLIEPASQTGLRRRVRPRLA